MADKKQWSKFHKIGLNPNFNSCPFCGRNPCECSEENKKEIYDLEISRYPLGKQFFLEDFSSKKGGCEKSPKSQ